MICIPLKKSEETQIGEGVRDFVKEFFGDEVDINCFAEYKRIQKAQGMESHKK